MNFLTEAEREGWVGWLANPPPPPTLRTAHLKKVIHEKTNGITWIPKNVEIRAITMHANAESSTAV